MKAWAIALLIMFVTASSGLIADLGVFDTQSAMPDEQEAWFEDVQNVGFDEDITTKSEGYSITGGFFTAIKMFMKMIQGALYIAGTLMDTFGVPPVLAAVLQIGIWAVYGVAVFQVITGKPIKQYE